MITRESIFAALFALAAPLGPDGLPVAPFVTASRKFQTWDQVGPSMQPAIFMRQDRQIATQEGHKGVTKWTYHCSLWVYCQHSPDQGTIPATLLNTLVDQVVSNLSPAPGMFQTLGGLVASARIDGDLVIDEGLMPNDTQSIARIPIVIIAVN